MECSGLQDLFLMQNSGSNCVGPLELVASKWETNSPMERLDPLCNSRFRQSWVL